MAVPFWYQELATKSKYLSTIIEFEGMALKVWYNELNYVNRGRFLK
jgi:hypothetical protein